MKHQKWLSSLPILMQEPLISQWWWQWSVTYVYSLFLHLSCDWSRSPPLSISSVGDNSALNTLNQSKTMGTRKIWKLGDLRCPGRVLFHEAECCFGLSGGGRDWDWERQGPGEPVNPPPPPPTHTHTYAHTHGRLSQCRWLLRRHYTHIFETVTGSTAASAAVFKRSKLISTDWQRYKT